MPSTPPHYGTSGNDYCHDRGSRDAPEHRTATDLVMFIGALKRLLGEGRWRVLTHTLRDAWAAGRDPRRPLPLYWERHREEPVVVLRTRLGIRHAGQWWGPYAAV